MQIACTLQLGLFHYHPWQTFSVLKASYQGPSRQFVVLFAIVEKYRSLQGLLESTKKNWGNQAILSRLLALSLNKILTSALF